MTGTQPAPPGEPGGPLDPAGRVGPADPGGPVGPSGPSDAPADPVEPHADPEADPRADPAEDRARSLLARIRRDPGRMPEELAVFAVEQMGPRAYASVQGLRRRLPDADAELLRTQTITRGIRRSVTEGSFVGGPFLVWIPVAFCRALLAQAQLLLELGCLAGRDPRAPERVAELLVLQGAYPDTDAATAALARAAAAEASPARRRRRPAGLWSVTMRMASILGLRQTGAARVSISWMRHTAQWLLLGVVIVVGMVAPLVWLPYMAVSYRRAGRAVAERGSAYYLGVQAPPPGEAEAEAEATTGTDPGLLAAIVRAVASVLLVVALVVLVLLTGARLADQHWPVLGLVLAGSSILVGAAWQRHRRARDRAEDEPGVDEPGGDEPGVDEPGGDGGGSPDAGDPAPEEAP